MDIPRLAKKGFRKRNHREQQHIPVSSYKKKKQGRKWRREKQQRHFAYSSNVFRKYGKTAGKKAAPRGLIHHAV
jgi:hypothetical protein